MSSPENTPLSKPATRSVWSRFVGILGSFQLAVIVIALSILLVFVGTLAQVNDGLYVGQVRWFKSWLVYWNHDGLPFFPGGYLLGTLFLANMICGHLRRFQRPPGGMPKMLTHYGLLLVLLWVMTHYLLLPNVWLFVILFFALLGAELWLHNKLNLRTGAKLGVDFAHIGIAMLLIGQLATDMMAQESVLSLREGETRSYSEDHHAHELTFTTDAGNGQEKTIAIPSSMLAAGASFSPPELPFKVTVDTYQKNAALISRSKAQELEGRLRQAFARLDSTYSDSADLAAQAEEDKTQGMRSHLWEDALKAEGLPVDDISAGARKAMENKDQAARVAAALRAGLRKGMLDMWANPPPMMRDRDSAAFAAARIKQDLPITGDSPPIIVPGPVGEAFIATELKEDRTMDGRNLPGAVVSLEGTAAAVGRWFVHPALQMRQSFEYGGKTWNVELRPLRTYHPLSLTLLKVTHDKYEGTEIPKDYRSRVVLKMPGADGAQPVEREVEIYMNYPLRLREQQLTLFQSSMDKSTSSTGLQVVKNPSWFVPYFGCVIVTYGLLRHFLLHLLRFMERRANTRPTLTSAAV